MDAHTAPPAPVNEPVLEYGPGSRERSALEAELARLSSSSRQLDAHIGGQRRPGGGREIQVLQPHRHDQVLGVMQNSTRADAEQAIAAARAAERPWRELPFDERAAVLLKAADLLAGPWRQRVNAATMLGQSKTAFQAEIDAACELIDFWRFNVHYASRLLEEQPVANSRGVWNRTDQRPLEGFVYAIAPFNFTSIAANLATAPALMGNTVLWKPSPAQQLAASVTMELLEEAGLPPGVINMLPGDGLEVSEVALTHPNLAGIHFTGSTATFQHLWATVGRNIASYRSYPRLVGETGGKDFILAHPSADSAVLVSALVRGAFEYGGQKCSAVSRAYIPRSVWAKMADEFLGTVEKLPVGDPGDFRNFFGAVIDDRAYGRLSEAIERAGSTSGLSVIAGGQCDDSIGWFVRPTVVLGEDPTSEMFRTEYFGPLLTVYIYGDGEYENVLTGLDTDSRYGLTGAIMAQDRAAIAHATEALRFAAGNFYINDKPTGAVVGQQPFGGGRASGTNDKAGGPWNLHRWVSPRSIKETFDPPTAYEYPHMQAEASAS